MVFKLLIELNTRELRTVFRRVGKQGVFQESQAIIQLTIYLVRIGQDPFTYRFQISVPEEVVEASEFKEAEDNDVNVQDGTSDVPENATELEAREVTKTVSVVQMSESRHLGSIEALDDFPRDLLDSESEETLLICHSGFTDGESVFSEIMPSSESSHNSTSPSLVSSSVCRTKSTPRFEIGSSLKASSSECCRCSSKSSASFCIEKCSRNAMNKRSIFVDGARVAYLVVNLLPELWPPDFILVFG